MRSRFHRSLLGCLVLVLAFVALPGQGGEPVPDVDVILEQIPGGIVVESVAGGFDRVALGGGREFVEGLSPVKLPPGWTLTREGRSAVLAAGPGAALDRPVRFRLAMRTRPPRGIVDWDVSLAGRSLAKARDVVPREVPPFAVGNSLQGIVYLPADAAPGDTLSFRPAKPDLPPGTFALSGVVIDEFAESEWASAMAIVNTTRSNIRKRAVAPPPEGLTLAPAEPTDCADLAALAAVLAAGDGAASSYRVARAAAPPAGTPVAAYGAANLRDLPAVSQISKAKHEAAMNAIRNMKGIAAPAKGDLGKGDPGKGASGRPGEAGRAFFAVTPLTQLSGEGEGTAPTDGGAKYLSIKEQGIEDQPTSPKPAAGAAKGEQVWSVEPAVDPAPGPGGERYVPLRYEPVAEGCRFTPREPTDLELARHQIAKDRKGAEGKGSPPAAGITVGSLEEVVYAVDLPEELSDATGLAVQYVDLFGDVLIDVPRAPVKVLPPRSPEEQAAPPCIESATPYVQAADALCVCGTFPSAGAAWALQVNERALAASAILSTSPSTVWFRLPEGTPPGRVFLSGAAEAGFTPACRAVTQLVEIGGALDSNSLLRGETTPMRLTVAGTADAVPLRIRNGSPAVIEIEGGVEQTAETSGGGPNVLERPVRALQPGAFDLEWTLATPACPCGVE